MPVCWAALPLVIVSNITCVRLLKIAFYCFAYRHLLHECGIGVVQDVGEGDLTSSTTTAAAVCQHRVLVFCQIKSMLDIIEEHLFK